MLVYIFTSLWSSFSYLWCGDFIVKNSPLNVGMTFARMASALGKTMSLTAAAATVVCGVPAIDEVQTKVFRATPDQLVTTRLRNAVDYVKAVTTDNKK